MPSHMCFQARPYLVSHITNISKLVTKFSPQLLVISENLLQLFAEIKCGVLDLSEMKCSTNNKNKKHALILKSWSFNQLALPISVSCSQYAVIVH